MSLFRYIFFALALLNPGPAAAQSKIALVIGNSDYTHSRTLKNPSNDATSVAEVLKKIGFDVTLKFNLRYEDMRRSIRDFSQAAAEKDIAVVYYAGHGLELGGENYLIPVDAKAERDIDLDYEAVTLSSVLLAVKPAKRLRLVILDACRTNPFADRMKLSSGLTRSVVRGLGRVEPVGDVLVAYSAAAGTVAQDGQGNLSPYASALQKHLPTPGLDIRLVLGKVRDSVLVETNKQQEPHYYGSLSGDIIALIPALPQSEDIKGQELLVAEARKSTAEAEVRRKEQEALAAQAELRRRETEAETERYIAEARRKALDAKASREEQEQLAAEAKRKREEADTEREEAEKKRQQEEEEREAKRTEQEKQENAKPALGWSYNYPSRAPAEKRALKHCAGVCKIAIWFTNACGAIAIGADGRWGADWGTDSAKAERKAVLACENVSSNCVVERRVCSGTYGAIAVGSSNSD